MKKDAVQDAVSLIEAHGFKVVRIDNTRRHPHIYTEPTYRFVCAATPGDHRWRLNFAEDVRIAARELKVPHPQCPKQKCRNMYVVWATDGLTIKRCDVCNQSLFSDGVKNVSMPDASSFVRPSSPSSGQRKASKG